MVYFLLVQCLIQFFSMLFLPKLVSRPLRTKWQTAADHQWFMDHTLRNTGVMFLKKDTTFRKQDLLPSSGNMMGVPTLSMILPSAINHRQNPLELITTVPLFWYMDFRKNSYIIPFCRGMEHDLQFDICLGLLVNKYHILLWCILHKRNK
jgi:hypothetical protein